MTESVRVEPSDRRVRVLVEGEVIADTVRSLYLFETDVASDPSAGECREVCRLVAGEADFHGASQDCAARRH